MSGDRARTPAIRRPGWWRNAVFYQVYPRSFSDADGNGVGDLAGITSRLDYLQALGVDALWLSPFFRSPMVDHGYDVSDPRDVDPLFGTLADFDELVREAHARGILVTIDIVPNHFSDKHPWFQAALVARPGSPERARFIFRDGRGREGELPPNNWPSIFGGPAWHRVADGQWYLHLFAPEQPDLDWTNREVVEDFERTLRFWIARGVDGFRIDVAHGMGKPDGLPDADLTHYVLGVQRPLPGDVRFDVDVVHDYHRGLRKVLDEHDDVMAIGEIWVADDDRLKLYVRPDELHLTFNFKLLEAEFETTAFRRAIDESMAALAEVGAPSTWVLSNHDVDRHRTRYGGGEAGLARARAAALIQLSLPGVVYIYQGDELGLENVELPDWALTDPAWRRSNFVDRGRDGERVPLPWSDESPPYGFGASTQTWLPMPDDWQELTVAAQSRRPDSTLELYREALRLRRSTRALLGDAFQWLDAPPGCLSYRRGTEKEILVIANLSDEPMPLPMGTVLLSSGPRPASDVLSARTTAWMLN